MKNLFVLVVKFISYLIAFSIGLDLFFNATITDIVSFSLTLTVITYFIGDRFILPHFGNYTATIADFFLSYLSVWIFGTLLLSNYLQVAWGSIISAVIITVSEVFVHRMLFSDNDESEQQRTGRPIPVNPNLAYGTEMADEDEFNDDY